MSTIANIPLNGKDFLEAIREFLKAILEMEEIGALLVPRHLAAGDGIMPALVSRPELLDQADPLAPAFTVNAAVQVSRLTGAPAGKTLAAVLRPCEIRAFVERVKLHQGSMENLILISSDCPGAFQNADFRRFAAGRGMEATRRFFPRILEDPDANFDGLSLASSCRACQDPFPSGADLAVLLWGADTDQGLVIQARSDRGRDLLQALQPRLGGAEAAEPPGRGEAIAAVRDKRAAFREALLTRTREATGTLDGLNRFFAACVNCYNCRVACPICYCRECVFTTDVFDVDAGQYLAWAERKGALKMPSHTAFFQLTRMVHVGLSCVGCGQCANACPNGIPVADLFIAVAQDVQQAFAYRPGADPSEAPPLAVFKEDEFPELTRG